MNAKEIIERIKNKKDLDNEWFDIRDEILDFLSKNPSEEEKNLFVPLGYLEMVNMMCDGIKEIKNK